MKRASLLLLLLLGACAGAPESTVAPPRAIELHGMQLLEKGSFDEARAVFRQAYDADPKSLVALLGIAQAATACGSRGEAERALRIAMQACPPAADARALLGRSALQMARLARQVELTRQYALFAARFLGEALRRDPTMPGLHYQLGCANLMVGEAGMAEPLLLSAWELDPSAHVALALAQCWRSMGAPQRVQEFAERLRKAGTLDPAVEAALSIPR